MQKCGMLELINLLFLLGSDRLEKMEILLLLSFVLSFLLPCLLLFLFDQRFSCVKFLLVFK